MSITIRVLLLGLISRAVWGRVVMEPPQSDPPVQSPAFDPRSAEFVRVVRLYIAIHAIPSCCWCFSLGASLAQMVSYGPRSSAVFMLAGVCNFAVSTWAALYASMEVRGRDGSGWSAAMAWLLVKSAAGMALMVVTATMLNRPYGGNVVWGIVVEGADVLVRLGLAWALFSVRGLFQIEPRFPWRTLGQNHGWFLGILAVAEVIWFGAAVWVLRGL